MTEQVTADFEKYFEFVDYVTSTPTKFTENFVERVQELHDQYPPLSRLLTSAIGMSAEAGEFSEIVKKVLFQGKPLSEENLNHLRVELGDILWYMVQACLALGVTLDDIAIQNTMKLAARYPEGAFTVMRSENRREGDI